MDWNEEVKGQWMTLKAKAHNQWSRLTDEDLKVLNGERDKLIDKIQERYGYARDRAVREVEKFAENCSR